MPTPSTKQDTAGGNGDGILNSRLLHFVVVAVACGVGYVVMTSSARGSLRHHLPYPTASQTHDRAGTVADDASCACDADAPVGGRASAGEFAGFKALEEEGRLSEVSNKAIPSQNPDQKLQLRLQHAHI